MSRAMAAQALIAAVLFASLPARTAGSAFLRRSASELAEQEYVDPAQAASVLDALEAALGPEHRAATEARLDQISEDLRTTFAALPKNENGAVRASAARYAMHRLFVQRHGWQVKGLEPAGESWVTLSPALALGDRVPGHVRDIFDERLGSHGFTFHDLAVFAATLENLIHGEAMGRLNSTYSAMRIREEDPLLAGEAAEVVDAYMASYILGRNMSGWSREQVRRQNDAMKRIYPGWNETQQFLREVQQEAVPNKSDLKYVDVLKVVEEVSERYGRFQGKECHDMKQRLVSLEEVAGTGRVHIADFYGSVKDSGNWQFSESVEYLRHLGAVDETDPENTRVIIPNYINSPSNCVASSSYYSVCCIDECEALMGQLEREIKAPTAEPEEIAKVIATIPSDSLAAGRKLSESLLRRLNEVAEHHGGKVPLHGRLFGQWMHYAYPRECPYPHNAGSIKPLPTREWKKATGLNSTVSPEELERVAATRKAPEEKQNDQAAAATSADGESLCSAMWDASEELVDPHGHHQAAAPARPAAASTLRTLALLALCAAFARAAVSALAAAARASEGGGRGGKPRARKGEEMLPF